MKCALIMADEMMAPANTNLYAAYEGFQKRGIECRFVLPNDLGASLETLKAEGRQPIVAGGIGFVKRALRYLELEIPSPLDYPEELRTFLGRRVWRATLAEVRDKVGREPAPNAQPGSFAAHQGPLFVKPAVHGKAFPGYVVASERDLIATNGYDEDMPVWVSEPIDRLVSEFRAFILRGEVLGVRLYTGDYQHPPSLTFIRQMIEAYESAPAGYSLDVGVDVSSGTPVPVLIEANDGYSLGNYGLKAELYAQLIEARWEELTLNPALRY